MTLHPSGPRGGGPARGQGREGYCPHSVCPLLCNWLLYAVVMHSSKAAGGLALARSCDGLRSVLLAGLAGSGSLLAACWPNMKAKVLPSTGSGWCLPSLRLAESALQEASAHCHLRRQSKPAGEGKKSSWFSGWSSVSCYASSHQQATANAMPTCHHILGAPG